MSDRAGILSIPRALANADEPWLLEGSNDAGEYSIAPRTPIASVVGSEYPQRRPVSISPWSRPLDVFGAVLLIITLAPVFVLVSCAIFVFDPGPVIFRHQRIGQDGKPFPCHKFRSMFVGAEERLQRLLAQDPELRAEWERDHKLTRDPRVSRVGHLLRVTSLDELPQLINVCLLYTSDAATN